MSRMRVMYVGLWLVASYFSYEQSSMLIFVYQHVKPNAMFDITQIYVDYWLEAIAAYLMLAYFTWRLLRKEAVGA